MTRQQKRSIERGNRNILLHEEGKFRKINKNKESARMEVRLVFRERVARFIKFLKKKYKAETKIGKLLRDGFTPIGEIMKKAEVAELFKTFEQCQN